MKEKHGGKMEEYPETPPWTMFFDGPLYQKYDEFMKNKDFSKILISTKLRLANSSNSGADIVSSTFSTEDDRWEKDQDDPTGSTYQYVTPDYYKRSDEDEKRRTRRTRAFILLGILVMAALAFGTALVIHYFFVPPSEDRNPGNIVNVSFAVNTTDDFPEATTVATDDEVLHMLDIMSQGGHTHDHDHDHEHILNPDGKIFDETFKPPETTTVAPDPETTTPPVEITTTSTTTTQGSTDSAIYELHLIPDTSSGDVTKEAKVSPTKPIDVNTTTTSGSKILDSISPKPYTSTMEIDHNDFFAMDDLFPQNGSSSTTPYDYDFLVDVTDFATTPTSTTPAPANVTFPATTVTKETTTFKDIHTTEEIKTTKDMLNETAEYEKVTVESDNVSTTESLPESTTTEHIPFSSTLSQSNTINDTTEEVSATESTKGSTGEVSTEPGWFNATTSAETSEPATEQPASTEGQIITKTTTDVAKTVETTTGVTPTSSK